MGFYDRLNDRLQNPRGNMQVGEPEIIQSPQEVQVVDLTNDTLEHPPSLGQRFMDSLRGAGDWAREVNEDETRGIAKGLTWGADDELGAGMNAATGGDFLRS